jgi:uncharacterized protein YbjT (DUF2867 family)
VARVLILGGGCRGRRLAEELVEMEHAVRIVTRSEAGRAAIEATGAECAIGTLHRLASLRGTLDGVSIACWLLSTATGEEEVRELHDACLRAWLMQAIDTTMRGFVYEAPRENATTAAGERIVREIAAHNSIPVSFVRAEPGATEAWCREVGDSVAELLRGGMA